MNLLLRARSSFVLNRSAINLAAKRYKGAHAPATNAAPKSKPSDVNMIEADGSNSLTRWHHRISYSLMIVTPVAIMFGPSSVTHTLDYALGLAIPFHSHVGLNYVISDYIPKAYRFVARTCLLAVTCITVVGIFKLNYSGEGLSGTLKALWKEPANKAKKE